MPYKEDLFIFGIHFPIMIFELIVFILLLSIACVILIKWKERKTIATLYLAIALFSISIAVLIAFTGLFSWYVSWQSSIIPLATSPPYYQISLPLGYSFVFGYVVFLFLFTIQIFLDKDNKKVIPIIIIGIIVISLLWLPNNYWGLDTLLTDPPSTRTLVMGLFLLYNVLTYIVLSYYAFREAKLTEQKEYQVGFKSIAYGNIANILIFVFFLLDAVLLIFNPSSLGYSIFIYLAWSFAIVAIFMFYLGFILPSWFRKYITK
ncbi:MAG: hypothetical protein ACTSR3_16240 [Candidatus Helarchaeota archaeon]